MSWQRSDDYGDYVFKSRREDRWEEKEKSMTPEQRDEALTILKNVKAHISKQTALILAQQAEIERRDAREERVREALFVLSDRLNRIGALNSDNVHAAYERVVAALNEATGR